MEEFERALRIVRDLAITFTCSLFAYMIYQAADGIARMREALP